MHERGVVAIGSWIAIAFGLWVLAWVIAEAIPVFNNLLSLIVRSFTCSSTWYDFANRYTTRLPFSRVGLLVRQTILIKWNKALTGTLDGLSGVFWLFLNRGRFFSSPRKMMLTLLNIFVVGVGAALVSLVSWTSPFLHPSDLVYRWDSDSTFPDGQFTKTRAKRAFLALITRPREAEHELRFILNMI